MKWKGIIKIFGDFCDLIICSSAGIIPLQYENYYPFNSYNSDGTADELSDYSKNLFKERLIRFFEIFHWEKIVFLFSPYEGAADVVNNMLNLDNAVQLPTEELWLRSKHNSKEFIGYSLRYCKLLSLGCVQAVGDFFGVNIPYLHQNFNRKLSLLDVIKDVYENMELNVGYSRAQLIDKIIGYNGQYDKSYISKVINGNIVGVPDYKYYIKNKNYFIKVGNLYFKNGSKVKIKNKLLF
jgi:hypothetical protein